MKRILLVVVAGVLGLAALGATAGEAVNKTVAAIHEEMAALSGQLVRVEGRVVKVNNAILGRNFLHVQDGTGESGTNDLTVTSQETANVGDDVVITGRVKLNTDFGAGYTYPLLVEEASITTK
jgi:hypothetical protein